MTSRRRVVFALPVFNEARNLEQLLPKILDLTESCPFEVLIVAVDDGSQDGSHEILTEQGCHTKRHEVNEGLGRTMLDALREAVRLCESGDIVITIDADNTQDPQDAVKMASRIADDGFALVIGSRYLEDSKQRGVPWHRRGFSLCLNLLLRLLFPMEGVRDYTSGYRAYRAGLLQEAFRHYGGDLIHEPGFAYVVELILKLRSFAPRATEVGIQLRYDQKQGETKIHLGKTMWQYAALLWRAVWRRP